MIYFIDDEKDAACFQRPSLWRRSTCLSHGRCMWPCSAVVIPGCSHSLSPFAASCPCHLPSVHTDVSGLQVSFTSVYESQHWASCGPGYCGELLIEDFSVGHADILRAANVSSQDVAVTEGQTRLVRLLGLGRPSLAPGPSRRFVGCNAGNAGGRCWGVILDERMWSSSHCRTKGCSECKLCTLWSWWLWQVCCFPTLTLIAWPWQQQLFLFACEALGQETSCWRL